ncbi:hypothetical protein ACFFRR_005936 [Megaselia abdita]
MVLKCVLFLTCLSMYITISVTKPTLHHVEEFVDELFGSGNNNYQKGYQQGLRDSRYRENPTNHLDVHHHSHQSPPYYSPHQQRPYYDQQYYPQTVPSGPYEHQRVNFNKEVYKQSYPYYDNRFPGGTHNEIYNGDGYRTRGY